MFSFIVAKFLPLDSYGFRKTGKLCKPGGIREKARKPGFPGKTRMVGNYELNRGFTNLPCTSIGLFPVLLWTFATSSITSTTLLRLEHWPSADQQVMWNWVTWWAFWVYVIRDKKHWLIARVEWMNNVFFCCFCFVNQQNSCLSQHVGRESTSPYCMAMTADGLSNGAIVCFNILCLPIEDSWVCEMRN